MTLRDYVLIVARSWIVVAVSVAVGLVTAGIVALTTTTTYTSTAQVLFTGHASTSGQDLAYVGNYVQSRMQTYKNLGTSTSMLESVASALNSDETPEELADRTDIQVSQLNTVASVSATDTTAKGAADTANTLGAALLEPSSKLEADNAADPKAGADDEPASGDDPGRHHRQGRGPDVAVRPGHPALPPRRPAGRPHREHRRHRAPGGAEGRDLDVVPWRGSLMAMPTAAGRRGRAAAPSHPRTCAARCMPRGGCTPPRPCCSDGPCCSPTSSASPTTASSRSRSPLGALIGTPLDSYFTVRAPRVSDGIFDGERTTRVFIGLGLVFLGWALWPFTFVGGLRRRQGRHRRVLPGIAQPADPRRPSRTARSAPTPSARSSASPSAPPTSCSSRGRPSRSPRSSTWPAARRRSSSASATSSCIAPIRPEITGRTASIVAESLGGVAYGQAGVILLGVLHSTTSRRLLLVRR